MRILGTPEQTRSSQSEAGNPPSSSDHPYRPSFGCLCHCDEGAAAVLASFQPLNTNDSFSWSIIYHGRWFIMVNNLFGQHDPSSCVPCDIFLEPSWSRSRSQSSRPCSLGYMQASMATTWVIKCAIFKNWNIWCQVLEEGGIFSIFTQARCSCWHQSRGASVRAPRLFHFCKRWPDKFLAANFDFTLA